MCLGRRERWRRRRGRGKRRRERFKIRWISCGGVQFQYIKIEIDIFDVLSRYKSIYDQSQSTNVKLGDYKVPAKSMNTMVGY